MNEAIRSQNVSHQELFRSICQQFGSARITELLVTCFGEQSTAQVLDELGVSGPVPGTALIAIYTNNRNVNFEGEKQCTKL